MIIDRLTIDGHLLPVLLEARLRDSFRNRHPGVRDEDVEFAKVLHYFTDRLLDFRSVRDFNLVAASASVSEQALLH